MLLYIQLGEMDNISTKIKAQAAMRAGFIYGLNGDAEKENEWYIKASDLGSATAQLNLGNNYNRDGDYKKALEMWLKASEQGEAQAQFNVGVFYYNGVEGVVEKDLNKAFEWFTRSKEGGFEYAGLGLQKGEEELKAMRESSQQ